MTFKSVHTLPTEDDEIEVEEFCTLLANEDTAGVLEIVLLLLDMLDKEDEMREEDVVCALLEVAELCGLEEPEPDPPPQAVKYMLSIGSIKKNPIFIGLLQSF